MSINISIQYNCGLLPDIIMLTQGYYPRGTRLNTMYWLCLYSLCDSINIITAMFDDRSTLLLFFLFFSCPCMAINVSVQYNGGLLPDIILLTQCYYHRGTRLNAIKRFCICSL